MTQLLVILDLDETLIHSPDEVRPELGEPDFFAGVFPIFKRPHLDQFIEVVLEDHQVATWTSASQSYSDEVVTALFGRHRDRLALSWSGERCTRRYDPEKFEHYSLKNLAKVKRQGFDLARVVGVDDSPEKYAQNYGNHIYIRPWTGDSSDDWLPELASFLRWVSTKTDVRRVEKRGWKTSTVMRD